MSLLWIIIVVVTNIPQGFGLTGDGYCKYRTWSKTGSLMFKVLAGIHKQGATGLCSKNMSKVALDHIIALDWITDILNGDTGFSGPFLDGHRIGYEIYDNCDNADVTTDILLTGSMATPATICSGEVTNTTNTSLTIGTIVLSNVETSVIISRLEKDRLVLRPLPSSSSETKTSENQAMLKTVVPFQQELMTIIKLLEHLQWNYVIEIHSKDEYGLQASAAFREAMKSHGICTAYSGLPNNLSVKEIYSIALTKALDQSIAVLYFGDIDGFLTMIRSKEQRSSGIKISWILPSNVPSTMFQHELTTDTVFVLNYDYMKSLEAMNQPFAGIWSAMVYPPSGQTGGSLAELISDFNTSVNLQGSLKQPDFDPKHLIDSVISSVVVACGQDLSKCQEFNATTFATIESLIKRTEINVTEHFTNATFYPYENEVIAFDQDGYQKYKALRVEVFSGATSGISSPWIYTTDGQFLVRQSSQPSYGSSNCLTKCDKCFNIDDIRYSYLHGDVIILGLFAIRRYGDTAFTCGQIRNEANDIITVSAFMHSVIEKRAASGIQFGALAIDDCYNGMNTTNFLFDLFNKRVFIKDSVTNTIIDMDRVVAIVGPLSSPVSLVVGDFAQSIGVPIVSYGASSPDLDNKLRYEYFLRTVPSDPLQVRGMIDILDYLHITHVGLVYIDDAYGINAKEGLLKEARLRNICIRDPFKLTQDMTDIDLRNIITNIFHMELRVVLFFGIDTIAKRLLVELKNTGNNKPLIFIASDGWGTNAELVDKDLSKRSSGSIVFTVSSQSYVDNTYRQLLEQLNMTQTQHNRWIPNYFENINSCELKNSFEKGRIRVNGVTPICNASTMSKTLSAGLVTSLETDQRAVHARLAVQAVTEGFKRFCPGSGVSTCISTVRTNTAGFIDAIKAVKVNNYRLFDEQGNGNIGYTIYNIQLNANGYAFYKEVGNYGTDGRLQITGLPQFYNTLGNNVSLSVEAEFRSFIDCSNYVVNNGSCSQACTEKTTKSFPSTTSSTVLTTSASDDSNSNADRIALIALAATFGVFLLVFLVVTILLFRWVKHKPDSTPSGTAGSASGMSDLDNMYHTPGSGSMCQFDNAGFEVSSLHSKPRTPISTRDTRIVSNGWANSVSSLGSGHVQYSDVRMLQPFVDAGPHIRQRSNVEMHNIHLDSFERPSSVLSVPVGNSYGHKTSPGLRKYKRQDLANLGNPNSNLQFLVPHSAPVRQNRHKQSRTRASSSPRFMYPSDDEHYVLPSDMQRLQSAQLRRLAVSEDDLCSASANNYFSPDQCKEPAPCHTSYLNPSAGNELETEDQNESQLNYATLMAKYSFDGDEEDVNEITEHKSHSSGSMSEIVFEDMESVDNNMPDKNKQSSGKGLLVTSPSDTEVMKINFPEDYIMSTSETVPVKSTAGNGHIKYKKRTSPDASSLPRPKQTMKYVGAKKNVPDIIKFDHNPYGDSDEDGFVFTI